MAMTLRLTDEQMQRLRGTAEREGVSMQVVAARAIDEYTNRRRARRDELIASFVSDRADLLQRLKDA